mmetsp:Transcript_8699/g.39565  ORF Transcript_8699/g.39565 Transcript_8699/m.39565 type:complete len:202 (+) Transcript_8699:332-937(+)
MNSSIPSQCPAPTTATIFLHGLALEIPLRCATSRNLATMYASLSCISGARRLGNSLPNCLTASVRASPSFIDSMRALSSSPLGMLKPLTSIPHTNRTRSHVPSACHVRRSVVRTFLSPRTSSHPGISAAADAAALNSAPGGTPSSFAAVASTHAYMIPHSGSPRLHAAVIWSKLGGSSGMSSLGSSMRRRRSQSSRKTTSG